MVVNKWCLKALLFLPLVSILQYFVGKPVNKLILVASRCQSDPYRKEIILLHAVRLSELSNLSVIYFDQVMSSLKVNGKWN